MPELSALKLDQKLLLFRSYTVRVLYRNLQLCPLIPEHALFAALPWVEKVEEAVSALLLAQGGTALCYLSQTFWKPALQVI